MLIAFRRCLIAVLLGVGLPIFAQSPGQPTTGPGNLGGVLYASSFAQWTVPQGNTGAYSWNNPSFCRAFPAGFSLNPVFKVGTPVKIVDTGNPAQTETVTVTTFNIGVSGCQIGTSALTYSHSSFYITSGTAGLQEAINFASGLPYQVIVTPDWTRLGGTDSMITSATGNTSVSILDSRTAVLNPYTWSGSAYTSHPFGGGLPSGTAGQLLFYMVDGTTVTPLTLGTNLSITGTTLNASATAATNFNALTSGTNTTAAMVVGTGGSISVTGSGTIGATSVPLSGISGLGTGVGTFLGTPSSANLLGAMTTSTGTGNVVFATNPVLVTPNLGTPSAATLTSATGLPISTGVSGLGTGIATFLATPSSTNLIAAMTTYTGTGNLVFGSGPTLLGVVDASGTTQFKLSTQNGYTSAANGEIGYDTTNSNWHAWRNGADNLAATVLASATITNSDCVEWLKSSNSVYLGDTGSACGAGGAGALSALTAATASNTLANGNHGLQIWNWAPTSNQNSFGFGETTAATSGTLGSQNLLSATTLAGSTEVPMAIVDSLTGSQTLPALYITPTWNTSGVVDAGILENVTNTASGTGSLLMDLQIGGTSEFKVDKAGNATALGSLSGASLVGTGSNGGYAGTEGTGASVTFGLGISGFYPDSVNNCLHDNFNNVDVGCAAAASNTLTLTNKSIAGSEINSGLVGQTVGGTGVDNTATLTLGTSNINFATQSTGFDFNTTITGAHTAATAAQLGALIDVAQYDTLVSGGTAAAVVGISPGTTAYPLVSGGGSANPSYAQLTGAGMVANTVTATQLAAQYSKWGGCSGRGLGDGLNAIPAGTYSQITCRNNTGVTVTITGVNCIVDGGSASTMNVAAHTLGALLTGAITCGTSYTAGTQSANVLLTSGDYLTFTFVADGTAKQTDWNVTGTY